MANTYVHPGFGTAYRKVQAWHAHDGSAWRALKKVYCHDGTDWRLVFVADWIQMGPSRDSRGIVEFFGTIISANPSLDGVDLFQGGGWYRVGNDPFFPPKTESVCVVSGVLYAIGWYGLYFYTDSDLYSGSWTQVSTTPYLPYLPWFITAIYGVIHTASNNGIHYWNGTTWSVFGSALTYAKHVALVCGNTYASTDYGLFLLSGGVWVSVATSGSARCIIEFDGVPHSAQGAGVYRLDGTSWTLVGSLSNVYWLLDVNGKLFAATGGGVYWLDGSSWTKVGLMSNLTYSLSVVQGYLRASTNSGVFFWPIPSTDL
jgi:hypothetical protein